MKSLPFIALITLSLPTLAAPPAYDNNLPTPPVPTGIEHPVSHIHHITANDHTISDQERIDPQKIANVESPQVIERPHRVLPHKHHHDRHPIKHHHYLQ